MLQEIGNEYGIEVIFWQGYLEDVPCHNLDFWVRIFSYEIFIQIDCPFFLALNSIDQLAHSGSGIEDPGRVRKMFIHKRSDLIPGYLLFLGIYILKPVPVNSVIVHHWQKGSFRSETFINAIPQF